MSILSKIFSSGATELIKGVGGVIDNLSTSDEERLKAKQKIKEALCLLFMFGVFTFILLFFS